MPQRSKKPEKEIYAWILDYLPYGSLDESKPLYQRKPVAQAVGEKHFVLVELVPKEGALLESHQRVYIGDRERDLVDHVKRRIRYDELSHGAQSELPYVIEKIIARDERRFVNFYNEAYPITPRMHMLELLPGIGKKLMWAIIEERERGEFRSFEDITSRLPAVHQPDKLIAKRVLEELKDEHIKYRAFV
ncbi:MAG: DUF655 domain-containing protein, partial [Methermicoccaceae archaeon]